MAAPVSQPDLDSPCLLGSNALLSFQITAFPSTVQRLHFLLFHILSPLLEATKYSKLTLFSYLGGCGQSFEAIIVSPVFEKKTTLARHRLVNGALKEEIAAIHAWTPKCFTPEEWEKRGGKGN